MDPIIFKTILLVQRFIHALQKGTEEHRSVTIVTFVHQTVFMRKEVTSCFSNLLDRVTTQDAPTIV
jgi:hypothetical protein